jgi:ABC-type Mn2+/Zn2+ transport system ATPase subunit
MKDWHFEHMQKTIVKYVSGISDDAISFQRKMHRKYSGKIGYVRRNIDFDIKHGVTREEVIAFLDKVRNDSSFSDIRKSEGSKERIRELQIEKQ